MARITVIGLWHLGCVISAALAQLGHTVTATDYDGETVRRLQQKELPVYEPDLAELMARQVREERLRFVEVGSNPLAGAECVFVTFDTPVDDNDQSDLTPVESAFDFIATHAAADLPIVLMSQVPVGTCRRLADRLRKQAPHLSFTLVYQPENLRLGEALKSFFRADLIVLGAEDEAAALRLRNLYRGIEAPVVTMSWESAEMVKHALNAFLGTSISFVNELADLAEMNGVDIRAVVQALRLDRRIGPYSFLSPGSGFSGGTLARDIQTLRRLGEQMGCPTRQLDATLAVNAGRLARIVEKIRGLCGGLKDSRLGLLGLTYKPGTNTLRRSNSLELARLLIREGSEVVAFDPQVREARPGTEGIRLCTDPYEVADEADALVVMTPWPEFRNLDFGRLVDRMRLPVVFDVPNCLDDAAVRKAGARYFGTGIAEKDPARTQVVGGMRLDGEVVFITGGGRGIGEAIARAFAGAGADLVLLSRTLVEIQRVAEETESLGVRALPLAVDVSRRPEVQKAVSAALAQFGRIDVLVNSAGILGPIGLLVENDIPAWEEAIQVNLMGTVYCLHEILPHMMARRKGAVINLSGGGAVSPFPRFSAYSASKAALVRLTETVAEEVKEFNIRVNAIAPGAVNTRLLEQVLQAGEKAGRGNYAKSVEQKRNGGAGPQRAAELAVFLASSSAEGITGRLISAIWDDWKSLPRESEKLRDSALFTLRRIDGRHFKEVR